MSQSGIVTKIIMLVLAVVIVVLVALIFLRYPTVQIPVATVDIKAGEIVSAEQLRLADWPLNASYPGLIQTVEDVVGKQATANIGINQPIDANDVAAPSDDEAVVFDPRFPLSTEDDLYKLKIFIPVDLRRSSGGVIQPGDYVNIIYASAPAQGEIIVQKAHAVAARTIEGKPVARPEDLNAQATPPPGATSTGGTEQVANQIAGFLIALPPDIAAYVASLPPESVVLVYTTLDAPDIPGVPKASDAQPGDPNTNGGNGGSADDPFDETLGSPSPSPSPADDPFATPEPSEAASAAPSSAATDDPFALPSESEEPSPGAS